MEPIQPGIDQLINQLEQEIRDHEQAIEQYQRDLDLLEAVRPVFTRVGASLDR